MAKQSISIGSSANDGTGDPLRTAFTKINANFTELYGSDDDATNFVLEDTSPQLGGNLDINGFNITSTRTNENIRVIPAGTGTVELEANTNVTGNLTATGDIVANGNINLGNSAGDQTKVVGVFEADQLQIDGTTLTSTVTNGSVTITGNGSGGVNVDNLTFNDNTISSASNADINLNPGGTGNIIAGAVTINGTTLSASDSSKITVAEALDVTGAATLGTSVTLATGATVTGILDEDAMGTNSATQLATQQSIKAYADLKAVQSGSTNNTVTTVTGANAFQGEANLTFNGSTLAVTGAATVSTTLGVTGTLTTADITTIGHQTITGTLDVDGIHLEDNNMTTNSSNASLVLDANGTGVVNVTSAMTTIGQTVTGTVSVTGQHNVDNLRLDGNVLSATSGGITLTPAAGSTVALGGVATATELHATTGEFVTLRCDALQNDTSNGNITISAQGTGIVAISPQVTLTGSLKQAIHTFVATDAITETEHAGRTLLLGEVGGNALVTLTLPDATGSGATYKFIVTVANTSNYVIVAPDSSNTIGGIMLYLDEDGTAITGYPTVAASDTITLNGGTTGGIVGDYLELVDIATDKWHVRGTMRVGAGTNPATPFSATV